MNNMTLITVVASIALPLAPQIISLLLLRRIWRSGQTHYVAMTASGMVQVLSGLWLARSLMKLPLFFEEPLSEAGRQWAAVTLDAGPYMATSLSLLAGWFWVVLALAQRRRKSKGPVEQVPASEVVFTDELKTLTTAGKICKNNAKNRREKKRR